MEECVNDYVKLTEDVAWVLIAAIADSSVVPSAQDLASRLLTRNVLRHFRVETGKEELLRVALRSARLEESIDFQILDLKSTMYKGNGDEVVFVRDWDGNSEGVVGYSDTISAFRDRPEAESILIVIDEQRFVQIEKIARDCKLVVPR
jgi:hypothetical protein